PDPSLALRAGQGADESRSRDAFASRIRRASGAPTANIFSICRGASLLECFQGLDVPHRLASLFSTSVFACFPAAGAALSSR
ncbi:MAG TPA: hypothetical protein VJ739_06585, partial [Gemmataceae bacterium]|nr:hypothetical protein [Gemmataceae bacterium]